MATKAKGVNTYNPKEVLISIGSHIITGFAEDSYVQIEQNGDGVSKVVGCDGEVVRALSPDDTYRVRVTLLQTSRSNAVLSAMYDRDMKDGSGMVPMLIKDLKGGEIFSTDAAWIVKKSALVRGRGQNNREWEFDTAGATLKE